MAKMKKSEKILTIFAGSALLIFVLNQFVCGESKPPKPKTSKKVAAKKAVPAQTNAKPTQGVRPRARTSEKPIRFASWGRDPFSEAYRLTEADSTKRGSDFVLKGVIWKGNKARVLIGDLILAEGERRGDLKILRIEKNRVVCKKGRKIVTLALRDDEG